MADSCDMSDIRATDTWKLDDGLVVETYYLECLAHGSYLVSHEGKAFLIDPRRDIDIYVKALEAKNLKLKGVMESHLHADFVSGHMELHRRMGTTIFIGENAGSKFPHYPASDGETFKLSSKYTIKAMATPGHTFGCVSWILIDTTQDNKAVAAFTGDTLFVGGVGRPDLVGALIPDATPEKLSTAMFDSLKKLMELPDECKVYPAHGPGSPCGKGISGDLSSTIGKERLTNPALQIKDLQEFIKFNTSGLDTAPQYFPNAVMTNLTGAANVEEELGSVPHLSAKDFKKMMQKDSTTVVLDTRSANAFAKGHVGGSMNIPLGMSGGVVLSDEDGNFAIWVGTLISPQAKILIISDADKVEESINRLARIGYGGNIIGVLKGGFDEHHTKWAKPLDTYNRLEVKSAADVEELRKQGYVFVDVRTAPEFGCIKRGHVKGAVNLPLNKLEESCSELVKEGHKYATYCVSGFRSTIGASIMRILGYDAVDVVGGYDLALLKYAKEQTTATI